jgi:hypothetical protein
MEDAPMSADDRAREIRRRPQKSKRQEKEGMRRFGGIQHLRSGAGPYRKNDGRTRTELFEFKRTDDQKCIRINATDLRELEHNALSSHRYPVLVFELAGRSYVILTENDYLIRVNRDRA